MTPRRGLVPRLLLGLLVLGPACQLQHNGGDTPPPIENVPLAPSTPVAAPTPIFGCGLPRGTGNGRGCGYEGAQLQYAMDAAIDKALTQHPELFDQGDIGGWVEEIVNNLRRAGFCAFNDGEEVAVKKTNDFSEQYDIVSGGGDLLRPGYVATCRPAWDAIPPAGDNS
jgi:hypothetical protein